MIIRLTQSHQFSLIILSSNKFSNSRANFQRNTFAYHFRFNVHIIMHLGHAFSCKCNRNERIESEIKCNTVETLRSGKPWERKPNKRRNEINVLLPTNKFKLQIVESFIQWECLSAPYDSTAERIYCNYVYK